ncbi:MAG: CARDB domain-containing protein [Thermoplasmatota archaeon]
MEGSDFDFYAQNRPKPEDFPAYEPLQPQVPEKQQIEKEPQRSFWQRYRIIVIAGGICLLVLIGVMLLALIDPAFSDRDLEVSIDGGGSTSGSTTYIDTDHISVRIRNDGSKTAYAEKITLRISGDNVAEKTVQWKGPDISSKKTASATISIDLNDQFKPFTLTIKVYYDGDYQSKDSLP